MGNRAVISFSNYPTGIYLHWNGGPESVLAFIDAAKEMGARTPGGDPPYALAGLVYSIGNFLYDPECEEMLSLGIGLVSQLDVDNFDNGHYVLDKDWTIKRRKHTEDATTKKEHLDEESLAKYEGIKKTIIERHRMCWS